MRLSLILIAVTALLSSHVFAKPEECSKFECDPVLCTENTLVSDKQLATSCPTLCDCRAIGCSDDKSKCVNLAKCVREPCDAEEYQCVREMVQETPEYRECVLANNGHVYVKGCKECACQPDGSIKCDRIIDCIE